MCISLDLNGSKIHTIYLVEMQNIYEMMAWWHDAMHMMQRWNATDQTNHTMKFGNHGRHLKLQSWGVTTLHHYERISSRDLGWHRREKEEEDKR